MPSKNQTEATQSIDDADAPVMVLSREQIIKSEDLRQKTHYVERWGGHVIVQELSALDRDRLDASLVEMRSEGGKTSSSIKERAMGEFKVRLVAASLVNEKGERLFKEKDIYELGKKSTAAVTELYDIARQLSNITDEDVEAVVGNSDDDQSDDSSSD